MKQQKKTLLIQQQQQDTLEKIRISRVGRKDRFQTTELSNFDDELGEDLKEYGLETLRTMRTIEVGDG